MFDYKRAHKLLDEWYPGKELTYTEKLELRVERLQREVAQLRQQAAEDSWKLNPDRSGGYTPPEEVKRLRYGFSTG